MTNRGDMPAMPVTLQPGEVWSETEDHASGMTIREQFAMGAMQAVLSGALADGQKVEYKEIARAAVLQADALLKELERTK